ADSTGKLKGMVSEKTRLSLLSFVDDVEWEIEEMERDSEGMIVLDNFNFDEEEEPEEEE
ncbi:MAG TPA: phage portal protein, partial [Clostridiales bacterium]|nr:phage portal protein [Clostridiales bacterium]